MCIFHTVRIFTLNSINSQKKPHIIKDNKNHDGIKYSCFHGIKENKILNPVQGDDRVHEIK